MKVLVIGYSCYDISCPVDEYPVENTKYRLNEAIMCGGGPAGNAAFLLGKWGVDTTLAGVIGSDDYGNKIKKEYENAGVKIDFLETNYEKPTPVSFIMINKKNGSRTSFNIAGDRPQMKKNELTMDPEPDIILLDGQEYNTSINALNKYPKAISVIDAGRITPELKDLCRNCKYIVSSKGFAETETKIKIDYANPNTLVQVYTELKNKYPKAEIVVTLEDKGALYAVNNEIKIMPGLKVTPADTTGAGDIFHGAFVYALSKGYDLEKCVRYANITAGLSVQKIGARLSIPSLTDVANYYNTKFPGSAQSGQSQDSTQQQVQTTPAQPEVKTEPQVASEPVVQAPETPQVAVQQTNAVTKQQEPAATPNQSEVQQQTPVQQNTEAKW